VLSAGTRLSPFLIEKLRGLAFLQAIREPLLVTTTLQAWHGSSAR
jgi:hypothetical protein